MDNPKKLFKVLLNEKEAFYIKTLEEESFESFRQQIFKRKPDLENKDFRVYWIDNDDDEIIISCEDDFKICLEDDSIKKIFVQTLLDLTERKRRQAPPKDIGKKLKPSFIELKDSDTSSSSSESSDDYTFNRTELPKSANKSTETIISSTSDSPRHSKDPGINIINIEVVRAANKVDENPLPPLEGQTSTANTSLVVNDDVMLVDDEETPLVPAVATIPIAPVAEPSNLVISDSDSEGFVETISITRKNKNPRSGRYNYSSQSIPDNIYNARRGPNMYGFESTNNNFEPGHSHHQSHHRHSHGENHNDAYARSSFFQNGPYRRFSAHAGRMPDFHRFRGAQHHAHNLFDGVQTMVSNISSTVNDNLRRSFGNAFPYNPRNA